MVVVSSQAIAMGIFVTNKVHTQMAENRTGVPVFRIAVADVLLSSRGTSLSLLKLGLHSMPIISPVSIFIDILKETMNTVRCRLFHRKTDVQSSDAEVVVGIAVAKA